MDTPQERRELTASYLQARAARKDAMESAERRLPNRKVTISGTHSLAHAIRETTDGDTIVCQSDAQIELGRRALARMDPAKSLKWEVDDTDN